MPLREYQASNPQQGCSKCREPFERLERAAMPPLDKCPDCSAMLKRLISAPAVGDSKSAFDSRARQAGFHKLKRLGKGEYEKTY